MPVQVGGGVRSEDAVEELLDARRVVASSSARARSRSRDWLAELAARHPGRDRRRLRRARAARDDARLGAHAAASTSSTCVEELNALPLGGLLVTAVHRGGQLQGTDLPLMEDVAEASQLSGLSRRVAWRRCRTSARSSDRGVAGAVIGMALYTGALDPWWSPESSANEQSDHAA